MVFQETQAWVGRGGRAASLQREATLLVFSIKGVAWSPTQDWRRRCAGGGPGPGSDAHRPQDLKTLWASVSWSKEVGGAAPTSRLVEHFPTKEVKAQHVNVVEK